MNDYKAFVTRDVEVRWLDPVPGVPLVEGRIGEARVFGKPISGGRYLIWANEETIVAAVKVSPKGAKAKIAHEARKEGEALPAQLESISGYSSESGAWSDAQIVLVDGEPALANDRTIGVESDGDRIKVIKIKKKTVTP